MTCSLNDRQKNVFETIQPIFWAQKGLFLISPETLATESPTFLSPATTSVVTVDNLDHTDDDGDTVLTTDDGGQG